MPRTKKDDKIAIIGEPGFDMLFDDVPKNTPPGIKIVEVYPMDPTKLNKKGFSQAQLKKDPYECIKCGTEIFFDDDAQQTGEGENTFMTDTYCPKCDTYHLLSGPFEYAVPKKPRAKTSTGKELKPRKILFPRRIIFMSKLPDHRDREAWDAIYNVCRGA